MIGSSGNLFIAPPQESDYDFFHVNLCEADREELKALSKIKAKDIGDSIRGFVMKSFTAWTVIDENTMQPIAIFGFTSREVKTQDEQGTLKHVVGHPWMLSTGDLYKYPLQAMKMAKQWVKCIGSMHTEMQVVASEDHPKAIPFLEKLGFNVLHDIDIPQLKGKVLRYV